MFLSSILGFLFLVAENEIGHSSHFGGFSIKSKISIFQYRLTWNVLLSIGHFNHVLVELLNKISTP